MSDVGISLEELAGILEAELVGDGSVRVERVAPLDHAGPGDLSFALDTKFAAVLATSKASAWIVPPGMTDAAHGNFLVMPNPYLGLARALECLAPPALPPPGVHATAAVDPSAELGDDVSVGPHVSIGAGSRVGSGTVIEAGAQIGARCKVGSGCRIHSNVVVRESVTIGDRVILQPGAVIGSDGFGYAPHQGGWVKIPQVGTVLIEDDVEIGANVTIDRATMGATVVGRGSKIDNLVQVAHNVVIGPDCAFAAQVGISGSTVVGKQVQLGGQSGIVGHIRIGDGARVGAQSGVSSAVGAGETVAGTPHAPHRRWLKTKIVEARLPELRDRVRTLERAVRALTGQSDEDASGGES